VISTEDGACVRLDKWLWAVRIFKTRPLATEACRTGNVTIGEIAAKPARTVRAGEIVTVQQGVMLRTLRVVGSPKSRVGATLVPDFCVELTPPEEFAKAQEIRVQQIMARALGTGRPTKRDRRLHDRLFE
jgi:ribosome-associated heat shock protein Hsp15